MTSPNILYGLELLLLAPGVALVVLALPLYRRRIPPNGTYGVRFATTLADSEVWYAINERGGRDSIVIGVLYFAVALVTFMLGEPLSHPIRLLTPLVLLIVALVGDAVILARAARRLRAQRARAGLAERLTNER